MILRTLDTSNNSFLNGSSKLIILFNTKNLKKFLRGKLIILHSLSNASTNLLNTKEFIKISNSSSNLLFLSITNITHQRFTLSIILKNTLSNSPNSEMLKSSILTLTAIKVDTILVSPINDNFVTSNDSSLNLADVIQEHNVLTNSNTKSFTNRAGNHKLTRSRVSNKTRFSIDSGTLLTSLNGSKTKIHFTHNCKI